MKTQAFRSLRLLLGVVAYGPPSGYCFKKIAAFCRSFPEAVFGDPRAKTVDEATDILSLSPLQKDWLNKVPPERSGTTALSLAHSYRREKWAQALDAGEAAQPKKVTIRSRCEQLLSDHGLYQDQIDTVMAEFMSTTTNVRWDTDYGDGPVLKILWLSLRSLALKKVEQDCPESFALALLQ